MSLTDRLRANTVVIQKQSGISLYKAIMYKNGDFQPWDTSDTDNRNRFYGVIFDRVGADFAVATGGVFPADGFADGVYYSDANGDLSTTPSGFSHEVGEVSNGLFRLNSNPSTAASEPIGSVLGWARYLDTTHVDPASAFVISGGSTVALPNDAGDVLDFLPDGVTDFYDGTYLTPQNVGDYYTLTVRFHAAPSIGSVANLDFHIDIGVPPILFQETLTFPKGAGTYHGYSIVVPHFSLNNFVGNGGIIYLTATAGGNISIHTISYQIDRIYSGAI